MAGKAKTVSKSQAAAKAGAPPLRVTLAQARAFWAGRQGLASPEEGPLPAVVARTGWLRTLGGADVYLALRARVPGVSRAAIDAESAAMKLRVLPAVRSCVYLVPQEHAALALRVSEESWHARTEREVVRAGATWAEVEECAAAVVEALASPSTTDALRRALPTGAARNLGETGKKVGLSSVLPVALRHLELHGTIERTLDGGRLDSDRYLWKRAKRNVVASARVPSDPAARNAELLRLFLSWSGPATLKDFASWSSLALREASAAAALLDVGTVEVEGHTPDALVLAGDVPSLAAASAPKGVRLLSAEDNLLTAHGGPAPFTAPADRARPVEAWGAAKPETLGTAAHLSQRTILAGGVIAGFWELDVAAGRIVTGLFMPLAPKERSSLESLSEETARFLLTEIGHGRSLGLDTDADVARRARRVASL